MRGRRSKSSSRELLHLRMLPQELGCRVCVPEIYRVSGRVAGLPDIESLCNLTLPGSDLSRQSHRQLPGGLWQKPLEYQQESRWLFPIRPPPSTSTNQNSITR